MAQYVWLHTEIERERHQQQQLAGETSGDAVNRASRDTAGMFWVEVDAGWGLLVIAPSVRTFAALASVSGRMQTDHRTASSKAAGLSQASLAPVIAAL